MGAGPGATGLWTFDPPYPNVRSMNPELIQALTGWVQRKNAVGELWLFGSRARGDHRPDSDHDFAIKLMPKKGDHDWSLGDFVFLVDGWKAELRALVGTDVHLVAFREDIEGRFDPTESGRKLWSRTG